jgi:hypothetical protein
MEENPLAQYSPLSFFLNVIEKGKQYRQVLCLVVKRWFPNCTFLKNCVEYFIKLKMPIMK